MERTTITLVRHGETEWNVAMRLQGFKDSPLTPKGKLQVKLLAEALKERSFDYIFSSDQGRALATANEIIKFHPLPISADLRLRERNFGVMEGYTREEILKKYPEVHEGYMNRKSVYQIPSGESLVVFYNRVQHVLNELASKYAGANLLVVAHGGVLDCAMRMVFSMELDAHRNFAIQNTAINTFNKTEERWKLEEWGNTDHLKGVFSLDEL